MSDEPLVSVIIPVFNGERYLGEAIESALAQSYRHVEIIIVNDGSTDSSEQIALSFGAAVRCHNQDRGGTGAARNAGIALSAGELLAFLDADDLWLPRKLELQVAAMAAEPEMELVSGHVQQFHSPDLDANAETPPASDDWMPGVLPSAVLVTRSGFLRVGYFGTQWQLTEWPDWWMRAMEVGLRTRILPDRIARRRLHQNNKGRTPGSHQERLHALKASLDRRRARSSPDAAPDGTPVHRGEGR